MLLTLTSFNLKAMKRACLILLLIKTSLLLSAQQWEIDFGNSSTYTWLRQGITDREQNAIFFGMSGSDKTDCYPYFIRVDQEGNHLSYVLGDERFHNLNKPSMVQMEDGNFFMVGDVEKNAIYAIVLDSDFNVLSCKRYDKPEDAHSMVGGHLVLDHDGTVVLAGSCNYDENGWGYRHYFCRFDNQADTIASRFYTPETQPGIIAYEYELDQLLLNPYGGFVLLGAGLHGVRSILRFDGNFNYMGGNQLDANRRLFNDAYSDHWLPNDQLLVMGRVASFDDNLESVGLAKLGLDGTMESIERFYCKRDTIIQTGKGTKCMAYVNDTTVYGMFYHQWYLGGPSVTHICLVDTEMEVLGLKEITTETSDYYFPGSILSTPDGGCIISVMEYHAFGENHYHGKIIKLSREDFNPIPCSVKEMPEKAIKALAYPNPAGDELNIDISGLTKHNEHRIRITDALGCICMDRIIRGEGNVLTVGVSGLKAGVYVYSIYNAEKEIVRNKFIKE